MYRNNTRNKKTYRKTTMKTDMQQTSLSAYEKILPDLGKKQRIILKFLKEKHPKNYTNNEISKHLRWSINRVTPRVYELRQLGLVEQKEKRPCSITGRKAIAWGITEKVKDKKDQE